jgi:hypothetical protein
VALRCPVGGVLGFGVDLLDVTVDAPPMAPLDLPEVSSLGVHSARGMVTLDAKHEVLREVLGAPRATAQLSRSRDSGTPHDDGE